MAISVIMSPRLSHAVDFDGTLAEYNGFQGPLVLGKAVPAMVKRVKDWLKAGDEVVVFTARINCDDNPDLKMQILMLMQKWCEDNVGQALEITDRKHRRFTDFYDDRAVAVERNTGKLLNKPQEDDGT